METKHTPGPWFGKKDGKYSMECPWSIDHDDGHNASWLPITTEQRRTIALAVNDDTKRPMDFHDAEMQANAKLIAAAPDLLAELEETHAALCFTDGYIGSNRHKRNAAAIAKATA
ncbi:hypothetical protein [Pseudomonas carnis]|jgi:predicted component of type VI protein secretion system|uniref:Uncharacterized protein n=1 Tax=Pseudomonas carnis TaxID=2487355 RepID=A0ABT5RQ33_9PSED|nr:hypothetical protein [Pseudomonas carnis]MDD1947775.1 hypothetical protein [Pseudomonas carnis]CAH0230814.1 hypothetical protein SRABI111_02661 [Pseudomonas carnis]CAH0254549.1 hypothetical protein SRABI110_03328 [Pseudomonas carnis]CAH0272814.1 hypothetical protein SRABI08_03669 [Pseudomonas carnis]CAH0310063.1 hypothetical protein SRABI64_04753 [Pseudomonas carnis]